VLNREFGMDRGFAVYDDLTEAPGDDDGGTVAQAQRVVGAWFNERRGDDVADRAVAALQAFGDKPFFLFVHFYDPHSPYQPPEPYLSQYDNRYVAEIAYTDAQIGRVLAALGQHGLDKDTLVILTADHGEGRGQHGEEEHILVYDTTGHVPLIVRAPGLVPAGRVVDAQVRLIDIAPTVLDFLGLAPFQVNQGTSLLPFLGPEARDPGLAAYAESMAIHHLFDTSILRAVRLRGWKYIHSPGAELYHVAVDPQEEHDLAAAEPGRLAEMREYLRELIAESPKPLWDGESSATTSTVGMKDETIEKLAALGYVAAGAPMSAADDELESFDPYGKDPKTLLGDIVKMARATAALRAGDREKARMMMNELFEKHPTGLGLVHFLSTLLTAEGKQEELADLYRTALQHSPDSADLNFRLGSTLAELDKGDEANQYLARAVELEPSNAGFHISLAEALRREGELATAIKHLGIAVDLKPEEVAYHAALGEALQSSGDLQGALASFRAALVLEPDEPLLLVAIATALSDQGDLVQAKGYYERVLEAKPELHKARTNLGLLLAREGRMDVAIEHFRQVVEQAPADATAHYNLGVALAMIQRTDEALGHFQQAVTIQPDYPDAQYNLADLLLARGQRGDAAAQYRAMLRFHPEDAEATLKLAQALDASEDWTGAIQVLRTGAERAPDHVDIANYLAWLLATCPRAELRDGQAAVALAERIAERAESRSPEVLDTLAAALAQVGRFEEATQAARDAMELAAAAGERDLERRIEQRLQRYQARQAP